MNSQLQLPARCAQTLSLAALRAGPSFSQRDLTLYVFICCLLVPDYFVELVGLVLERLWTVLSTLLAHLSHVATHEF